MLINKTLTEYLEVLSSDSPTPGGGSALATVCATAVSLVEMACNVTIAKLKRKNLDCPDLTECLAKLSPLKQKFLSLVDEDCQAFEEILSAMRLKKDSQSARENRFACLQQAYINSATVCMSLIENAVFAREIADEVIFSADEYVASDAKIGKELLSVAMHSQKHNVLANVDLIDDSVIKEHFLQLLDDWLDEWDADEIL